MLGILRRPNLRRAGLVLGLGAGALVGQAALKPAHAWWRGGWSVGIGFPPIVVAPPVYYPPAAYYPPPPLYYPVPPDIYSSPYATAPYGPGPQASARAPGTTCYAGAYVCPLAQAFTPGSTCSCPDNAGRRVYGRAQ